MVQAGFVMICATIVSVLGILLETVLAWLSAIPAGFLGTSQLNVLPKVFAGTARSLATWLTAAQMKGYAVTVASLATLQETALLHQCRQEK